MIILRVFVVLGRSWGERDVPWKSVQLQITHFFFLVKCLLFHNSYLSELEWYHGAIYLYINGITYYVYSTSYYVSTRI